MSPMWRRTTDGNVKIELESVGFAKSINWERRRVQFWNSKIIFHWTDFRIQFWNSKISFLWTDLGICQQTLPVLASGWERWNEGRASHKILWKYFGGMESYESQNAQTMEAKTSNPHLRMFSSSILEERKPSTWFITTLSNALQCQQCKLYPNDNDDEFNTKTSAANFYEFTEVLRKSIPRLRMVVCHWWWPF